MKQGLEGQTRAQRWDDFTNWLKNLATSEKFEPDLHNIKRCKNNLVSQTINNNNKQLGFGFVAFAKSST